MRQSPMCSAVCQQSHSRVPARTDQSRSVIGSSPLITHEITLSRSSAVTVMVPSSLLAREARLESPFSGGGSGAVLVVAANPELRIPAGWLVPALRHEIEELVGAVHHVDPAGVGGVGVEHAALLVAGEDADPLAVLEP